MSQTIDDSMLEGMGELLSMFDQTPGSPPPPTRTVLSTAGSGGSSNRRRVMATLTLASLVGSIAKITGRTDRPWWQVLAPFAAPVVLDAATILGQIAITGQPVASKGGQR